MVAAKGGEFLQGEGAPGHAGLVGKDGFHGTVGHLATVEVLGVVAQAHLGRRPVGPNGDREAHREVAPGPQPVQAAGDGRLNGEAERDMGRGLRRRLENVALKDLVQDPPLGVGQAEDPQIFGGLGLGGHRDGWGRRRGRRRRSPRPRPALPRPPPGPTQPGATRGSSWHFSLSRSDRRDYRAAGGCRTIKTARAAGASSLPLPLGERVG